MKILKYRIVKCDKVTLTVGKVGKAYQVGMCTNDHSFYWTCKCPNREIAKNELIKKLQVYTNLRITEILRGLF